MNELCTYVGYSVSNIWDTYVLSNDTALYGTMINVKLPTNELLMAQSI